LELVLAPKGVLAPRVFGEKDQSTWSGTSSDCSGVAAAQSYQSQRVFAPKSEAEEILYCYNIPKSMRSEI